MAPAEDMNEDADRNDAGLHSGKRVKSEADMITPRPAVELPTGKRLAFGRWIAIICEFR